MNRSEKSASGPPGDAKSEGGRLDSWKEIAGYLKRGVRSVQRWEQEEGLPVHRHLHKKLDSVYAFRNEIDAWLSTRRSLQARKNRSSGSVSSFERYSENVEAYSLYLKGRQNCNPRTPDDLLEAIRYFNCAIEIDVNYAPAYSGIADCYNLLGYYCYRSPVQAFPKAKSAALKALRIDGQLAEGHAALGFYELFHEWNGMAAAKELKLSMDLNPQYAAAAHWYGLSLLIIGQPFEAVAQIRKAWALDPASAVSNTYVARAYYFARQYDHAVEKCLEVLRVDRGFIPARLALGWTYRQKSMLDAAVVEFETILKQNQGNLDARAGLGHAYAASGDRKRAQNILAQLKLSGHRAIVCLGLRDWEAGMRSLAKAVKDRYPGLIFLKLDPMFEPLQSHPGLKRLAARVGLK